MDDPVVSDYGDALRTVTQEGGRPDGWPHDVWSLIVWAAIGCEDWPDSTAELDIVRQRQDGGDPAVALVSLAPTMQDHPHPDVVLAAAWAGLARVALDRRDDVIRGVAVPRGSGRTVPPGKVGLRRLGAATGLSHVAVGMIRDRDLA